MAWSRKVPADAARACTCGTGTLRPRDDKTHFDADGTAMVGLSCDGPVCRIESVHYWTWKWETPAETARRTSRLAGPWPSARTVRLPGAGPGVSR